MKFNIKAFAITMALYWGFALFFLTWWLILFQGATREPTFLGKIYIGYTISPLGSVIGLIYALLDGFIGGLIFAWLYNFILSKVTGIKEN